MKYEQVGDDLTHDDAERVAAANDNDSLINAMISLSLYDEDRDFATAYCLRFKSHAEEWVRGAAMIGLGHLSRRFKAFGKPSAEEVAEALKAGLKDSSTRVSDNADDAADSFEHFLKIKLR